MTQYRLHISQRAPKAQREAQGFLSPVPPLAARGLVPNSVRDGQRRKGLPAGLRLCESIDSWSRQAVPRAVSVNARVMATIDAIYSAKARGMERATIHIAKYCSILAYTEARASWPRVLSAGSLAS
jgi:hypothetical protein